MHWTAIIFSFQSPWDLDQIPACCLNASKGLGYFSQEQGFAKTALANTSSQAVPVLPRQPCWALAGSSQRSFGTTQATELRLFAFGAGFTVLILNVGGQLLTGKDIMVGGTQIGTHQSFGGVGTGVTFLVAQVANGYLDGKGPGFKGSTLHYNRWLLPVRPVLSGILLS